MTFIKYFSNNDMSTSYYLGKIENFFNELEDGDSLLNVNEAIQLYNIEKYINSGLKLKRWSEESLLSFKLRILSFPEKVAKFFKSIKSNNIIELIKEVDAFYNDDFWELIEKYKVYITIDDEIFGKIVNSEKVSLHQVLKNKKITNYFGGVLREHMLSNPESVVLLLDKFEIRHNRENSYFLPQDLSITDMETIIIRYIESDNPNYNYLCIIANIQSGKNTIEITDKTKLKAKMKKEEIESRMLNSNSGIEFEHHVIFDNDQEELVKFKWR
jgi:hypothetical protein